MIIPAGMSAAEAVARLFNAARPLGTSIIHYRPDQIMTKAQAEELLSRGSHIGGPVTHIDYLDGRVMKVIIAHMMEGREGWDWAYNRDNGKDWAQEALTEHRYCPPDVRLGGSDRRW